MAEEEQIIKYISDAVILSERDILHGNRVVSILTKEYGIIDAFANGSKNAKSKIMGITQPLVYSNIVLDKKGKNFTVKDGEIKHIFYPIREDIDSLLLAFYLAEITKDIAPKGEKAENHINLFLNTLYQIENKTFSHKQIKLIYELRLMSISGYLPNLVACANCGIYEDNVMHFLIDDAYLLCSKCIKTDHKPQITYALNKSSLSALRHIIYSDDKKLFTFNLKGESLNIASHVCENYILSQMGRDYKTLKFYKEMTNPISKKEE